jgi:hypothetical protein
MNHLTQLKQLKGKPHLYKSDTLVINDYELDEEGIHLQVTRNNKTTEMLVPVDDVKTFFTDLLPVEDESAITVYTDQQSTLTQLRKQLMEVNTKLNGPEGEKFIKQAKAINNNINTLLNSLKLELAVVKEMKRNQ